MTYKVYYRKEPTFMTDVNLTIDEVQNGTEYAFIKECTVDSLEELFVAMQGEMWSPNGEARELITKAGCHHTSMSVGDVAIDSKGKAWQCDLIGWLPIK